LVSYRDKESDTETRLDPADYAIKSPDRAVPLPENLPPQEASDEIKGPIDADALSQAAATAGLAALAGDAGPVRDSLVYGAALCLCRLGCCPDPATAAEKVRQVIDAGHAARRFEAAVQ
jgi:hypothetical protein